MTSGWSLDFTYNFYKDILRLLKDKYEFHLFREVPNFINSDWANNKVLLRHDIDLDLTKAVKMAEIEFKLGIKSTYMVMINCPFYLLADTDSQKILNEMLGMGHEIALHFDSERDKEIVTDSPDNDFSKNLESAVSKLEQAISSQVFSISFHRPAPTLLNGQLLINNRVNAYAKELMGWYLSDSRGNWREGNPLPKLANPSKKLLQLLTHPFWWAEKHLPAIDCLEEFFILKTKHLSAESADNFDSLLSNHLTIQRKGRLENA